MRLTCQCGGFYRWCFIRIADLIWSMARRLREGVSPLNPDNQHFHNLLFAWLNAGNQSPIRANNFTGDPRGGYIFWRSIFTDYGPGASCKGWSLGLCGRGPVGFLHHRIEVFE